MRGEGGGEKRIDVAVLRIERCFEFGTVERWQGVLVGLWWLVP